MQIQSYLCFEGRAAEAIEFYQQALGAEVTMKMTFSEIPEGPGCNSDCEGQFQPDKICHASLKIGESEIMVTDGMAQGSAEFKGISLSLSLDSDELVKKHFNALADGGNILQPLNATFFASSFGMVADRFGVTWMVLAPAPVPA